MLNIDSILSTLQPPAADKVNWANTAATGCTSILCNKDEVTLKDVAFIKIICKKDNV